MKSYTITVNGTVYDVRSEEKLGTATKAAQRSLADFDQLERLNGDTGSGSSTGTSSDTGSTGSKGSGSIRKCRFRRGNSTNAR